MGEKRKNKDRLCTILMIVFFSILAILVILPIYTIFLASFKPGGDLLQYGLNLGIDWSRMSLETMYCCLPASMITGDGSLTVSLLQSLQ